MNMLPVPTAQISWKRNGDLWEGTTEASDLGWGPGVWPDRFVVEGVRQALEFQVVSPFYTGHRSDRELGGYMYENPETGIRITVYND